MCQSVFQYWNSLRNLLVCPYICQMQIESQRDRWSDMSADPAWGTPIWGRDFRGVSEREVSEDMHVRWDYLTLGSAQIYGAREVDVGTVHPSLGWRSELFHLHNLSPRSANSTSLVSGSITSIKNGLEPECSQTGPWENWETRGVCGG